MLSHGEMGLATVSLGAGRDLRMASRFESNLDTHHNLPGVRRRFTKRALLGHAEARPCYETSPPTADGRVLSAATQLAGRPHGKNTPLAGNALEGVVSAVVEHDCRPRHQILDRA